MNDKELNDIFIPMAKCVYRLGERQSLLAILLSKELPNLSQENREKLRSASEQCLKDSEILKTVLKL